MTPELEALLRDTSRSFYLTLRILPASVRPQIGLAYLLARATDTIADTELVPVSERLAALEALRQRIEGTRSLPLDLRNLVASSVANSSAAERQLLERIEPALALLPRQMAEDQADIRTVLATITGGQVLDLERFGGATASAPVALTQDAELDDYTYRVAGCVGEFWTRVTRRHCFPAAPMDGSQLVADGIRFGKGLQLVNILRDIPRDLRTGRCYLPAPALAAVGLSPRDLLDPAAESRLQPVYQHWLRQAEDHLAVGWRYTLTLPRNQRRLRLACAWPILLGVRTLAYLRRGRVLDSTQRIKVSRAEVRSLVLGSLWKLAIPSAWSRQYKRAGRLD